MKSLIFGLLTLIQLSSTGANPTKTTLTACKYSMEQSRISEVECFGDHKDFEKDLDTISKLGYPVDTLRLTRVKNSELPPSAFSLKVRSLSINASSIDNLEGIVNFVGLQRLSIVDVRISRIPSRLWILATLKDIEIRDTDITSIGGSDFGNTMATDITISNNRKLTRLKNGAFETAFNLRNLCLASNSIGDAITMSMLPAEGNDLRSICLSGNRISGVEGNIFERMPKLQSLDLKGNKIVLLPEETYNDYLYNGGSLSVTGNEIECDCGVKWLGRSSESRYSIDGICSQNSYVPFKFAPLYILTPEMLQDCS